MEIRYLLMSLYNRKYVGYVHVSSYNENYAYAYDIVQQKMYMCI
jgi:hypothetical protein